LKITYDANINGFYYRPRTDLKYICEHSEGLICTTACIASPLTSPWLFEEQERLKGIENFEFLLSTFGDRLYLELQFNELDMQKQANDFLLMLAERHKCNIIYGLDAHYANKEDVDAQDFLILNNRKMTVNTLDWQDKVFSTRKLYIKSYSEAFDEPKELGYRILDKDVQRALESTIELSDRCSFEIQTGIHPPNFLHKGSPVNADKFLESTLIKSFYKMISKGRIPSDKKDEYFTRMQYEFKIIRQMNYCDYFLIIWDMVKAAKARGIFLGAGRGSGAGCLVSFVLGISEIDPVKYGLLFERFITPERKDPPDIDLDWESERGNEVEDYLKEKYGEDHVAHVASFATWKTKNSIKEVFKTLGESIQDADRLTAIIGENEGGGHDEREIDEVVEIARESGDKKMIAMIDRQEHTGVEIAKKLVGGVKHVSKHAGGTVISPKPIFDYIPVVRRNNEILTGFAQGGDGQGELEEIGLIKIDNLKVEKVSVIKDTLKLIKERHDEDINVWQLEPDDSKVYEYYRKGRTEGVFQLETAEATRFMVQLKPENFEDLRAVVALFRPGTLSSGEAMRFIKIKNGKEKAESIHPALDKILETTYGCVVYQEQIMQIMNQLAGIPLAKTTNNIKLLKKIYKSSGDERIEAIAKEFEEGLKTVSGFTDQQAAELMNTLKKAFEYIFNKSHATAYGFVSYITMWLKVHYPLEFFCSLFNWTKNEEKKGKYGKKEIKLKKYIEGAMKIGIKMLPPVFGKSKHEYTIEGENIRAGIKILVGLGAAGNQLELVEGQRFEDVIASDDVSFAKLNAKKIEILLDSGFFDGTMLSELNRRQSLFAWKIYKEKRKPKMTSEKRLSNWNESVAIALEECNPDDFSIADKTAREKECFRFFFNTHPMQDVETIDAINEVNDEYKTQCGSKKVKKQMILKTVSACNADKASKQTIVGFISEVGVAKIKRGRTVGERYFIVTIEDHLAEARIMVWPKFASIEQYEEDLKVGDILAIRVKKMSDDARTYQIGNFTNNSDIFNITKALKEK